MKSEETMQLLKWDWDMREMLELWDREYNIAMINVFSAAMEKGENVKEQIYTFKWRIGNPKKESKGNTTNQKHCHRHKKCL